MYDGEGDPPITEWNTLGGNVSTGFTSSFSDVNLKEESAVLDEKVIQLYLTIVPKSEAADVPFLKGKPFQGNKYAVLCGELDGPTEYVIVAVPCAFGACLGTEVMHTFASTSMHDAGPLYLSMAAQHTTAQGELLLQNLETLAHVLPPLPLGARPVVDPFGSYRQAPGSFGSAVKQGNKLRSEIMKLRMEDGVSAPCMSPALANPKLNRIKYFLE